MFGHRLAYQAFPLPPHHAQPCVTFIQLVRIESKLVHRVHGLAVPTLYPASGDAPSGLLRSLPLTSRFPLRSSLLATVSRLSSPPAPIGRTRQRLRRLPAVSHLATPPTANRAARLASAPSPRVQFWPRRSRLEAAARHRRPGFSPATAAVSAASVIVGSLLRNTLVAASLRADLDGRGIRRTGIAGACT